jgi:transcriptional regulator with XRE-family HTH domain
VSVRPGEFSITALYEALDEARLARGLSWQAVSREVSARFVGVQQTRAVSASTITGLRSRPRVEADGVLQMLLWLGRTPESFTTGVYATEIASAQLEHVGPGRILRFDTKAVYAALDAVRLERKLTWKQVADEIGGIAPSSLTRFAEGGRTTFPDIMRVAAWLGRPVASLTHASEW